MTVRRLVDEVDFVLDRQRYVEDLWPPPADTDLLFRARGDRYVRPAV